MRQGFLKTFKGEITDKRIAAKEEMQTQGGSIQIPGKYKLYGDDLYKDI